MQTARASKFACVHSHDALLQAYESHTLAGHDTELSRQFLMAETADRRGTKEHTSSLWMTGVQSG